MALSATHDTLSLDLIHRRLGHVSTERCCQFVRQLADLSEHEKRVILSTQLSTLCEVCLVGKLTSCGVS